MSRQSIVLLSAIDPVLTYTSNPVRVDSWYTGAHSMYTISIAATNFRGILTLQGSIKSAPQEVDWFPILLKGQSSINYPRNGIGDCANLNLGGQSGGNSSIGGFGGGINAETSTLTFNFGGRYVWMRAIVDRSATLPLDATPKMIGMCGFIDRILLNL